MVIPVFNNADSLEELYGRIKAVLESMELEFEVIFVDDGSQDASWETISKLKSEHTDQVKGLQLTKNSGQQAATFCGLKHAKGQWILTVDDDLQYPPEEIRTLWEAARNLDSDVLYGKGTIHKQRILRRWGAKLFRKISKKITLGFPNGSSFRLIRGDILQNLPQPIWPWSYVDPVLFWLASDVATVNVREEHRQNGKSGYSLFKLSVLAINILIIYSTLLLQIMIFIGFLTAIISLFLGLFFLIQKLAVGAALGFSSIIVTITFVSGVILISLGILGIYLAKIYRMSSGEPAFVIKKTI